MAPFHLPASFKAFARGTKQEPVPSSPDSFHSPIAKLDDWHPVPAWRPEQVDVDPAPPSGRAVVAQAPTSDRSPSKKAPGYNVEAIRDLVLPPFDFKSPFKQVSKSPGNRPELLDRGRTTVLKLRRPSTAQAVGTTKTRTHVKGSASASRLPSLSGSVPLSVGNGPYVPARRPPPPPIQVPPVVKPPAQDSSFQHFAIGDSKPQRLTEKSLPRSAFPAGITTRARSNSASVAAGRAAPPAPLKRTWEDIALRPPKPDATETRPGGAPSLDPAKASSVDPGTETTSSKESLSRVTHRSASSPSLFTNAEGPSIPTADSVALTTAPSYQQGNLSDASLDRKLTLGSFRRNRSQVAVPLSPVLSEEDGKSTSRKSDEKPSFEVQRDPYIPRSGDLIISPAFILAGPESMSNMAPGVHGITSTLFPYNYSLIPASDGPRTSSDSGLSVPPHAPNPDGMTRQDSATLPQEYQSPHSPPPSWQAPEQPQNDPSGIDSAVVSTKQHGQSATESNHLDHHGPVTTTDASVVFPPRNITLPPKIPLIAPPAGEREREPPGPPHLAPQKTQPLLSFEETPNITLQGPASNLCRSLSDASLRESLSRSSSRQSRLSDTSSVGRTSPLRKTSYTATASSPPPSNRIRQRERSFDSTKRLLTGSRVENAIFSLQHSVSLSDMKTGQRLISAYSSVVDFQGRNTPPILLEPTPSPLMTVPPIGPAKGLNTSIVSSSSGASDHIPAPKLSLKQLTPFSYINERPPRGFPSYTHPFSNRQLTPRHGYSTRPRSASEGSWTPPAAAVIQSYAQPSPARRPSPPMEGSGAYTPSAGSFMSSDASPGDKNATRLRRKRSHKSARAIAKALSAAAASSQCPASGAALSSSYFQKNAQPSPNTPAEAMGLQTLEPAPGSSATQKTTLSIPRTNARPGLPVGPRLQPTAGLRINGIRLGIGSSLHPSSAAPRNAISNAASNLAVPGPRPKIDTKNPIRGTSIADSVDSPASPCFQEVPVRWKGMTLDRAKWTFTSKELQAMVGRAIKQSSAEVTAIRLLSPQVLDVEIPEEIDRLETERDDIKARYGHQIRLRKLLMRSLDLYIDGSDPETAHRLLNDLRDVSALCETLGQQLHVATDQLSQINALRDQHLSSALIMALHKLNAGFLIASSEMEDLKSQLAKAQAESEDGWNKALELERELDSLRSQLDNSLDGSAADDSISAKGYSSGARISRVAQARQSSSRLSKASLRPYSRGSTRSSTHSSRFPSLLPPSTFPPSSYASPFPPPPVPALPMDFASYFGHHSQKSLRPESIISRLAPPMTSISAQSSSALALVQAQNEVLEMLGLPATDTDNATKHRRSRSQPDIHHSGSASSAEQNPVAMVPTRPPSLLIPSSPTVRRRMSDFFVKDGRTPTSAAALQTDDYTRSDNLFRTMMSRVDVVGR